MPLDEVIKELITRRRAQIIVHSCIYYRLGESIIEDSKFDQWAYELAALQEAYPDIAKTCHLSKEFNGFDGTTGFHLPQYGWIINKAQYLLAIHKEKMKNGTN